MGRKKDPDPAWRSWKAAHAECQRKLGAEVSDRALEAVAEIDRRLGAHAEAAVWDRQFATLRRVGRMLAGVKDAMRKSHLFVAAPEAQTWREALEAAWENPVLNALAIGRGSGSVGLTPGTVKERLKSNLTSARWAIRNLKRLNRSMSKARDLQLEAQRTSLIAVRLVEFERSEGRRLVGTDAALLDLATRRKGLRNEEEWVSLRQRWDAALRRARRRKAQPD